VQASLEKGGGEEAFWGGRKDHRQDVEKERGASSIQEKGMARRSEKKVNQSHDHLYQGKTNVRLQRSNGGKSRIIPEVQGESTNLPGKGKGAAQSYKKKSGHSSFSEEGE